jgi:serine phosphatase RsbU (regulator of sigma subunit)
MENSRVESSAFQTALLRSESHRIIALLGVLGVVTIGVIARNLAAGQDSLLYAQLAAICLAIACEFFVLSTVRRALRTHQSVSRTTWVINVILESSLPTLGLLLLIESDFMDPYRALVAPAVLLYFLFIILSTLRLNPLLSSLTGLLSGLGYIAVAAHVIRHYPQPDASPSALPPVYITYSLLIFVGGLLSAGVAVQIRRYVFAALRKTELQCELDRVHHDLDVARSIQRGLLPARPPTLGNFEMAGWNEPAEQTGGDYFDWQSLPDGRLAISVGDATGHGIGPALVTASCRAYARASFLSCDPDCVLDNLNRLLAEDLPDNRFVTLAIILIDPLNSEVKVLSAGHGPILWYRYAADRFVNLEAHGLPLGVLAGIKYGRATDLYLGSNDMLVVVTDGFYEWENPEGEEFGMARLEAAIRESRDCPAEQIITRLRASVVSFCRGTEQKDDLTAVILRRKREPLSIGAQYQRDAALKLQTSFVYKN